MKKIIDYKNLSIGKKFTVTLCLILMLPLMILFLWINKSVTEQIVEENCKTNLAILKQTENALQSMIQDITAVSLEVIGNEDLQNYLKAYDISGTKNKDLENDVKFYFGNKIGLKNQISRVSIFTEEELLFQFGKYMFNESGEYIPEIKAYSGRMLWLPAAKDENYMLSRDKNIYEVNVYRAINNHDNFREILAYERVTVSEDYICDVYSGIANENTKEMFIVNSFGEVISSLNKELLGTNLYNKEYFSELSKKREGYSFVENNKTTVSFYYLPNVQWHVVKIDDKVGMVEKNVVVSISASCMLLSAVFGVVFYYVQRKRIIEPIIKLSKDVSMFQEGNYEIGNYMESSDEIGILNNNFIEMGNYIQDLIEHVYKSQLREKEAQLQYLQSQINPHFLYNTLDSMRWMAIKERQYNLAEQIEALSNLFKHALNQGKKMTTVEQEVQHLKDYLTIQNNRFGDRIKTTIFIEEGLEKCIVFNLILQPLVENAIVHGLESRIGGGCIDVKVKKEGNNLVYLVEDNGVGVNQEAIRKRINERTESHNVLALDNINQRIKCRYGDEFGITFYSQLGSGTKVEVRMPLEGEE